METQNPKRAPRCTVPDCADASEGRCESCGAFRCEDHGRIEPATGGFFCGMRDQLAELAKQGRYDESGWRRSSTTASGLSPVPPPASVTPPGEVPKKRLTWCEE
jgi:hypothetical protein